MPIDFACPGCRKRYQVADRAAGLRVDCRACGGQMRVPELEIDTSLFPEIDLSPRPSADALSKVRPAGVSYSAVTTPLLISAISNLIVGLILAAFVIGIPLIVLGVFEVILFSKSQDLSPDELGARAKSIGIFEVVGGLLNWISLVCGILVLINCGKLRGINP